MASDVFATVSATLSVLNVSLPESGVISIEDVSQCGDKLNKVGDWIS